MISRKIRLDILTIILEAKKESFTMIEMLRIKKLKSVCENYKTDVIIKITGVTTVLTLLILWNTPLNCDMRFKNLERPNTQYPNDA